METAVPNNQYALISVISGAVAWLIGGVAGCALLFLFPPAALCTGAVFFIGSLTATITGHMARNQIKANGGAEGNDTLALAGLIMGWLGIAANVAMFCLIILGIFGLTLMGPQIGNVFSDVIRELGTPMP